MIETREAEMIREAMLSAASTPINLSDFRKFVATIHEVLSVWQENADSIDKKIFDFHYRRRMRFAEIAAALTIPELSVRRRWNRLLAQVTSLLDERVRSDDQLAPFASLMIENPDVFRLALPTILSGLSVEKIGPETTPAEVTILRRAVQTFGNHADAVHWLLDDCPALNGRPIDVLIDPRGVKDVENVLGCIDHGLIF